MKEYWLVKRKSDGAYPTAVWTELRVALAALEES